MKRILVIGLGGTIGSVKGKSIGLDANNLKILDFCQRDDVELVGVSPFSVLSENMTIALWKHLIDYINNIDKSEYLGIIVLHGSDTLTFTAALLGNAFYNENIVLVASDKPIEDKDSNGISNFNKAIDQLMVGERGVFVSYNGIMKALCVTNIGAGDDPLCIDCEPVPVNSQTLSDRKVLLINSYVGLDMDNYVLNNVDAVLIGMYHSATVPEDAVSFAKTSNVPVFFATHKSSADYESAQGIENIIFNTTLENAYVRLLIS